MPLKAHYNVKFPPFGAPSDSKTIQHGLDLLKEHDIKYFLRNERIDYQDFLKCAQAKNVHHLVFNPFYFEHLFKMYNEKHVLPNRNELMKDICESVFDLDWYRNRTPVLIHRL